MIWGEGRNEVQIDPLLPPTYIFFAPQLTPYNILQNLTTNWVGVRLPPTYIFGDPLLTPTYIFNFIPTPLQIKNGIALILKQQKHRSCWFP